MFILFLVPSFILILTLLPLWAVINPLILSTLFSYTLILLLTSLSQDYLSLYGFACDSVRISLSYVTFLVIFISYITSFLSPVKSYSYWLSILLLFLSCFLVFSTTSILSLYIFYEASLLPIVYIILKWGTYPDRGSSALSILLFTRLLTFPLGLFILCFILKSRRLHIFFLSLFYFDRIPLALWIIFRFAVKLPVYGLHFWLPIAHVEAPTFGSTILAGVLLKIGSCGLLRLSYYVSPSLSFLRRGTLSYLLLTTVYRSLLCSIQSDFKRLVAYSSVVHITIILLLFLSISPLSYKTILLLRVFHGFSSPSLFMLVGAYYQMFMTRLILILRGILLATPLLAFLAVLLFTLNVPVPPYPSFFAEVCIFLCVFHTTSLSLIFIFLLSLLVIVYSLFWFVSTSFGSPSVHKPQEILSLSNSLSFFSYITPSLSFILILTLL